MFDPAQLNEEYGIPVILKHSRRLNQLCSVAGVNPNFSPERIARLAEGNPEQLVQSPLIWECLTCGLCREVTDGRGDMARFIRAVRREALRRGIAGSDTHGGIMLTAQRIDALGKVQADRNAWIAGEEDLKVERRQGDTLYWVGAAPFLDSTFPDLGSTALESARAAIRLLNHLGIRPVVLEQERFSGHDLLWTGDREGFSSLAAMNMQAIRDSGAKTVIVSSPEDCHTLKMSYKELVGELGVEVLHLSEFLADRLSQLSFSEWPHRISYHDPCRLGRGLGVYDAPRKVLRGVPGLELVEMEHSREMARCCGTSCWINCTRYSKLMQVRRLQEAGATGAEALVTPCSQCVLHFRCATRAEAWTQVRMDVRDWTVFLAGVLQE
ncbi:MAG: (Fe-S)-binding protein [Spirochaetaceae bacterium]|nr:MAG: (Fe-S)-binding protein [Spirochaetaceae bacterium]